MRERKAEADDFYDLYMKIARGAEIPFHRNELALELFFPLPRPSLRRHE